VASIREKSGRYEARVWVGGRGVSRSFGELRAAKKWALGVETGLIDPKEKRDREAESKATISLIKAAQHYHADTVGQKKGGRQEAERIRMLERYEWARKPLHEISPEDLKAYRNQRLAEGRSGSTIRLMLSMVSAVYEHAREEWGYKGSNPVRAITLPKPAPARHRRLDADEEKKLFAALAQCRNPFVLKAAILAIETGMRRSELLSLRWGDIDMKRATVHLVDTKNGHPRWVPLTNTAHELLKGLNGTKGELVLPISASLLTQAWGHALRRASIKDFRWHDLRHEALSRWAHRLNGDVFKLASISGHRTLQMAQRYTHPSRAELISALSLYWQLEQPVQNLTSLMKHRSFDAQEKKTCHAAT
jgi:integrase